MQRKLCIPRGVWFYIAFHLCTIQRWDFLFIIRYSEIVKVLFESVLRGQAGVAQITTVVLPLFQTAIIEQLDVILNDERYNVIPQAFLEKKQTSDSSVSVLKRVNALG